MFESKRFARRSFSRNRARVVRRSPSFGSCRKLVGGGVRLFVFMLLGTRSVLAADHVPSPHVPPWLEIEILDPNVDSRGRPAVVTGDFNGDGQMDVDIPRTVLVHRYYYTGERSFQGPMLPGGPSVIVAGHPRTGERCYVNAQLLPGAPRIIYCDDSIEYNYGDRAICITFGWFGPKVTYRNAPALGQRTVAAGKALCGAAGAAIQQSAIPVQVENCAAKTKNVAHLACDGVCHSVAVVTTPVRQVVQVLPFGKMLTNFDNGEKHAMERRERVTSAAQDRNVRLDATIPTLR